MLHISVRIFRTSEENAAKWLKMKSINSTQQFLFLDSKFANAVKKYVSMMKTALLLELFVSLYMKGVQGKGLPLCR